MYLNTSLYNNQWLEEQVEVHVQVAHPQSSFPGRIGNKEMLDVGGEGKTTEPREKPLGEKKRTINESNTWWWCRCPDLNPGNISGRQVLSPVPSLTPK